MAQSRARRFFASSTIYFLGTTLSHLIQFFLLPLYTRAIDPADYGNYDLWTNVLIFLAPVAFFQIWDAVYRYWFDGHDREALITNGYAAMLLGLGVYTVTLVPVLVVMSATPAWLIFLFGVSWCVVYFYAYLARAELRNGLFVGGGIVNSLLNAGLGVTLVLGFDAGITGVYIAVVAGNVVQALIIESQLRTYRRIRRRLLSADLVKVLLRFSLPLCLASVAAWALAGFTRVAINGVLGNDANGLYAVADKYTYVITMVMSVFQFAWSEMIYLSHKDDDRGQLYRLGTSGVLTVAIVGGAGTVLLARLTWDFLVGPSYAEAWTLVPLQVAAAAVNSSALFMASLFMAEKKTNPILWTTLVAAAVNLVLAFPLVSWLGLAGGPIALILACSVMLGLRVALTSRAFGVMVLQPDLILSVLVFAAVSAFYWTDPSMLLTALVLVGVGIYGLLVTRHLWTPMVKQLRPGQD